MIDSSLRVLLFNLATDVDDPVLGFTSHWIRALAERVESIDVVTMRIGKVKVPQNVRVHSVGKELGYSELRRAVRLSRIVFQIVKHDRVDVCFSHMIPLFTVLAAPILKTARVPIATWYVHPNLPFDLRLAHYLSDRMLTSVRASYPHRGDKLTVMGHGIDTRFFSADGLEVRHRPPMILCSGRLSAVKNHSTLLEAAGVLRSRTNLEFEIVLLGGPGSDEDSSYVRSLHRMCRRWGVEDLVRFESPVPLKEVPPWLRRCTVHVNMTPWGSADKVVLEAMACGRPSLAANSGFEETFGQLADRLLFQGGDAVELADRLTHWLTVSDHERTTAGQYLRKRAVEMHDLEGLADRLVTVLLELKDGGRTLRARRSDEVA